MQNYNNKKNINNDFNFIFKKLPYEDGKEMYNLVKKSKSLDLNSLYYYIIMAYHYDDFSLAAYHQDELAGFITSYLPPKQNDTLFIWQVCVGEKFQGKGLGKKMICHLALERLRGQIQYIEATITPSNKASIALFSSVARQLGAEYEFKQEIFPEKLFGEANHESEFLFKIGPIKYK